MVEEYDPNQFRSVESEEEEEEELRRQGRIDAIHSSASAAPPDTRTLTQQQTPVRPVHLSNERRNDKQSYASAASGGCLKSTQQQTPSKSIHVKDNAESEDEDELDAFSDEDYSDLSDSCDDIEMHLLKEDSSVPDRVMQSRYQGFAERLDLSEKQKGRMRDRKDFATTQHVLDRRTQTILFTMMQQQLFHTINGCVSTGKEANVYHAIGSSKSSDDAETNYAVKVYMTSTTSFRDRAQYVSGDYRMRNTAPHRRSTYAMVKFWAEKEFRNLSRIHNSGKIAAPRPVRVKGVVLVMEFVGDKDGNAAPRLKDAFVEEEEEWRTMYWEVVRQMRVLYQNCGLVHGDLNEYNMLYHEGKPWIIDVSQSVMHEKNPNALLFLRKDVGNVTTFFRNCGVHCLTVRELFEFIVTTAIGGPEEGVPSPDPAAEQRAAETDHLKRAQETAENRPDDWTWEEAGAFLEEHIPANLAEVDRPARDIRAIRSGKATAHDLPYAAMAGLQTEDFLSLKAKRRLEIKRAKEQKDEGVKEKEAEMKADEEPKREMEKEAEGEEEEHGERFVHPSRPRKESPSSRRQRKAEVKAAQREQRVSKKEERVKWEKKERAKQQRQPKFTRLI